MCTNEMLRVFHPVGPGDVVNAYRAWKAGKAVPTETSRTYSGEFFSFCAARGLQAWVVSSHPSAEKIEDGLFIVENRPRPGPAQVRGLAFHVQQVHYALTLARSARAYRPDLALMDSGTAHWFLGALIRSPGCAVVANLHNTHWPAGYPPSATVQRALMRLNGLFFRWAASAGMGVSPECERQFRRLGGGALPFYQYRSQYDPELFQGLAPPSFERRPFQIMFAGRVERSKGVFDIVEMARLLEKKHPGRFRFDICGDGSALEALRLCIRDLGLGGAVGLHGRLNRAELTARYGVAHLVIVPTRSDFVEGLAMVAAEAVLAGRPVLANPVVPACEVLGDAAIAARTNDVGDYVDKIERLASEREAYERAVAACPAAAAQFADRSNSLEAALGRMLEALRPGVQRQGAT